jgi:hypothetical protein
MGPQPSSHEGQEFLPFGLNGYPGVSKHGVQAGLGFSPWAYSLAVPRLARLRQSTSGRAELYVLPPSSHSVDQTVEKIEAILPAKGVALFG